MSSVTILRNARITRSRVRPGVRPDRRSDRWSDRGQGQVRRARHEVVFVVTSWLFDNDDMCRNIKTLFNFDPPATDEEIRAASLQFVRKLSGFNAPSRANEDAYNRAIEEVAAVARRLIDSLETNAPPKNRDEEAARARARAAERFGTAAG